MSPLAVLFGGSGFIGSHLREELSLRGYRTLVADIVPPTGNPQPYEYCDVRAPISLAVAETPDVVFNLAAIHKTPGHNAEEYYETNIWGAINITDWCSRAGVKRLIFTSSISVYGPTEEACDETAPLHPVSAYGHSKAMAEVVHARWVESVQGSALAIVRPAVIFGPGERGNFTRLASALRAGRFVYPGRSDTIKACGSVWDLANALIHASTVTRRLAVYNFCYPDRYTVEDICGAFRRIDPRYLEPRMAPIGSLSRLGSRIPGPIGILAQRVRKLTLSTNIVPKVLLLDGFQYSGNLETALQRWYESPPYGSFI